MVEGLLLAEGVLRSLGNEVYMGLRQRTKFPVYIGLSGGVQGAFLGYLGC